MNPKWLLVAKNEYRIRTSFIRRIRSLIPFLVVSLLAVYVLVVAPTIVNFLTDEVVAFLLSQAAVALVQIILFVMFIYFLMLPITSALREGQIKQLYLFLSAPVKSSDVLLGQFLGAIPLYAIIVTLVTGFFTALLTPLKLDIFQIITIVIIFVMVFLSALWIGTVIAAVLRTKLGKTARGKDIGRALAMILVLPLVAFFYAIQFGGLLTTLTDPGASGTVKTLLGWLPSSWSAEIIVTFAQNPGDISAAGWETAVRCGGLFLFFVVSLWVGALAADRLYSLEWTTFISAKARPDGIFYKTLKSAAGGKSLGTLVVSLFKDYSRRLENLSNISYMLGILVLMMAYLVPKSAGAPDEPPAGLMMIQFIFPIIVVMITGEVTVRGKESLFIYRKAPAGEIQFIKSMIIKGWLMALPIGGVVTLIVTQITLNPPLSILCVSTGLMMLLIAGLVVFVLGLFMLNPPFSEKSPRLWVNIMATIGFSITLFIAALLILTRGGDLSQPLGGLQYVLGLEAVLGWMVGLLILSIGYKRLIKIE